MQSDGFILIFLLFLVAGGGLALLIYVVNRRDTDSYKSSYSKTRGADVIFPCLKRRPSQ